LKIAISTRETLLMFILISTQNFDLILDQTGDIAFYENVNLAAAAMLNFIVNSNGLQE